MVARLPSPLGCRLCHGLPVRSIRSWQLILFSLDLYAPVNPIHIGPDDVMERELYFVAALDFAALPQFFSFPSRHFVALLVADTGQIPDETLGSFART